MNEVQVRPIEITRDIRTMSRGEMEREIAQLRQQVKELKQGIDHDRLKAIQQRRLRESSSRQTAWE